MKFIHNFELDKERYRCKLCGESVSATSPSYYLKHIRDRHPELTEMAAPYVFWSPEQEEELVRLVGESIRRQKDSKYMKGVKEINWVHIAKQMNHLCGSRLGQMTSKQAKSKWDRMIKNLPKEAKFSLVEKEERSEKNGYVFIKNCAYYIILFVLAFETK